MEKARHNEEGQESRWQIGAESRKHEREEETSGRQRDGDVRDLDVIYARVSQWDCTKRHRWGGE